MKPTSCSLWRQSSDQGLEGTYILEGMSGDPSMGTEVDEALPMGKADDMMGHRWWWQKG